MSSIEFQMSLLLFVALGGYQMAARIAQPAVVGVILAGLIIGPSVLGWVTYTEFVKSMAHLGAVILLFVTGLEFKLESIAKWRYAAIGFAGVVLPWAGGYALASLFGFDANRSMVVGVALTATSVAITADTLRELGKLQTQAAQSIIGAAVIDDILALMALAVSNQMARGSFSTLEILWMLVQAVLFLSAGVYAGRRLITPAVQRIDESRIAREFPEYNFIFAMMVAFLYAMAAELVGLSAIIGSFVAGVSLEGVSLRTSKHFKEGAEYLRIIFGAIFFISLGIIADIKAFTPHLLWFLLALVLVAILTKAIGCGLTARLLGMSRHDSLVVGFGMAPRGEVAMIVALLALNDKVIDQPSYVALVMMSLLTTLVVPLLFRNWLFRSDNSPR
jgi:Kef-type K+ transport system membrane component KefB